MKAKVFALTSVLILALAASSLSLPGQPAELPGDTVAAQRGNLTIHPINHATFALHWSDATIFHSRGSDLEKFKSLVGTNAGVEVRLRDWYSTK